MTDARKGWCPNCKMMYRLGPPAEMDWFSIGVGKTTMTYLLSAAREFDDTAQELTPDEHFTAVDFMDWLKPFLLLVPEPEPATLAENRRLAEAG